MKDRAKKFISWLLTFAILAVSLPATSLTARAVSTLTISQNGGTGGYTQDSNGNIKITASGSYTISGSSTAANIVVSGVGSTNITLNEVDIEEASSGLPALGISSGATVNLTLQGSNTLKGGSNAAGLQVTQGAAVTIIGTASDSLTATGGGNGAGIGGCQGNSGIVTITGGTVTATGGYGGAGIGGGCQGSSGTVSISGGTVTATGGYNGAGIGGGSSGNGDTVSITGGTVTATGGYGGAGIGGGDGFGILGGGSGGTISISGGTVIATRGGEAAGIGGGNGNHGTCGTVTITGGTVTATGDTLKDTAGIGSGHYASGGTITITGGSVRASVGTGVTDGNGHTEDCVHISTTFGGNADVTGSVNCGAISTMQTDTNGMLYLWMPATGSAVVKNDSTWYSASRATASLTAMQTLDIATGSITIASGSITQANNPYTYSVNDCVINQSGSDATSNTVSVTGGTHNIVLGGVNIASSSASAFGITGNAAANLTLSGTNKLQSGSYYSGIDLNGGNSVAITGTGSDSLDATGGTYTYGIITVGGAGIGGGNAISFEDHGIVKGNNGSCGHVSISGGIVKATGKDFAAGIGGYFTSSGGNITIAGGTVTARGGSDGTGAGIGGGYGGSGGTITITGGSVTATGGQYGAGIGGGYYGNGGTTTITGGSVIANGLAGIGGGNSGSAGTTTIIGGSVHASSIQGTPTNGGSNPAYVYCTTVTIPTGKNVNFIAIKQSGAAYSYGYKDIQADAASYGKLYLWLPVNTTGTETTADAVTDGGVYTGYHGTVSSAATIANPAVLKMDQSAFAISNINSSYTYGDAISNPTTTGGAGSVTYTYSGTDSVTNTSLPVNCKTKPTNFGSYTVTATNTGDAAYYPGTASANFAITPINISTGFTVTLDKSVYTYTGSEITPAVTVKDSTNNTFSVSNYDVTYSNNTNLATSTDTNAPTVTVTGKGNYTGSASAKFTIEALPTIAISGDTTHWALSNALTIKATAGSSGIASVTVSKASDHAGTAPTTLSATTSQTENGTTTNSYSFSTTSNDTYTFTVTSNSGLTATTSIPLSHIDTAAPAFANGGNISGNPTTPAQFATLSVTVSPGSSGIGSVVVSNYDNGQWVQISGAPISNSTNTDGSRTYTYTATDNGTYKFTIASAAGVSADSNSAVVTEIDTAKPVVAINANGYTRDTWTNKNVTLSVSNSTANLGTTAFEYTTDGKHWSAMTNSIIDSTEGITNYLFRARSASGVVSDNQSITVKIDKTAPTGVTISTTQNPFKTVANFLTFGLFFGDTIDVNFSASDNNGSGIDHYEYQKVPLGSTFYPGGTWQIGGGLSISSDFKGTIYARAVDMVENRSGTVTKALVVDKTAPVITAQASLNTIDKNASILVEVKDEGAGVGAVTYTVNGGSAQTLDLTDSTYNDLTSDYTFSIGNLPDGKYDVVINAADNSGNPAATATVAVNKDTSPKVTAVAVTPGSASLDHGASQSFTAAVTGTNDPSTAVNWSVKGNKSSGTTIDASGKLTVAADESAASLTVIAASVYDNTKSATATITINNANQTGFGFESPSIIKTFGDSPFTVAATGGQGGGKVTYAVTSGSEVVAVDAQTGKVTINKAGSAFITATKAADGSFHPVSAAVAITVNKASTAIRTLPSASDITILGKLSASTLTGGAGNVDGSFTWSDPDTLVSGSGSQKVTFTPKDTDNYTSCAGTVNVTVLSQNQDPATGIVIDTSGVTFPDGVTSATLSGTPQQQGDSNSSYSVIVKLIGTDESRGSLTNLTVYDITLLDQNGNPITGFTGKIKVKIPIPSGMSGDLHIYWYDPKNNTLTDMNAVADNGYLVFETTHFSTYAIAQLKTEVTANNTTTPSSNPKTGETSPNDWFMLTALPAAFGVALAVKKRRLRFKRKP